MASNHCLFFAIAAAFVAASAATTQGSQELHHAHDNAGGAGGGSCAPFTLQRRCAGHPEQTHNVGSGELLNANRPGYNPRHAWHQPTRRWEGKVIMGTIDDGFIIADAEIKEVMSS